MRVILNMTDIQETKIVLSDIRKEIAKVKRLGNQGVLIVGKKVIPDTTILESYLKDLDQQLNNLYYLEEVYTLHLKELQK